jgi:hypothetical protein
MGVTMDVKVPVKSVGGGIEVRMAAGFAGKGATVAAALYEPDGSKPQVQTIVEFGADWSGVKLPATVVGRKLYVQFNAASLLEVPEPVNVILRLRQDGQEVFEWTSESVTVEGSEIVKFKFFVVFEEA